MAAGGAWMVSFVDLDTGSVIGLVDGGDSAAVRGWLAARPRWWRRRVRVVAIDPSAAFRSAVKPLLPNANVSVDYWHLIKLGNDAVTKVRQRVAQGVQRTPRPDHRPGLGAPPAAATRR